MTSKANTPAITPPPPITQDDPTWQKCLSLLKAMKEVTNELRAEAELCRAADPASMFPKGYSERAALIEALQDARLTLAPDLRQVARANGLQMPEGL